MYNKNPNTCQWLIVNTTNHCDKPCIGDYCGPHAHLLRRSPRAGTNPCLVCNVGVAGQIHLCDNHGRLKYRSIIKYYQRRSPTTRQLSPNPPTIEQFLAKHYPR